MPTSTTRQPLDRSPAITACFTISPEVRGSLPITIVPEPTYVPKACAKRVNRIGVSESPMTPRTPEILILRVGKARMINVQLTFLTGLGPNRSIFERRRNQFLRRLRESSIQYLKPAREPTHPRA